MKKIISTLLFSLVAMTGWAQVKCHIEGELLDKSQGVTVIVCPASMDLRVSDDYVTAKADDHGHFSCDVTADKMMLYKALLEEQHSTGCWSSAEFLVENNATVKLSYNHDKWKVLSGGPEQMLKVQMDAEADRLFHRMNEISQEGEEELMPLVEKLRKEGIDPETDTVLVNRMNALKAEYDVIFKQYKAWELEYYKKRKASGRQKHNAKWTAVYNDFVACYEKGMPLVEIADRNNLSERSMYRYLAYYKEKQAGNK